MALHRFLRRVPERLATGAYILHSGIEKWTVDAERPPASTAWRPVRIRSSQD